MCSSDLQRVGKRRVAREHDGDLAAVVRLALAHHGRVLADENDDMIGRIGLEYKEENKENGTPDGYYLGYAILPKWRKKGLAAKAASRLLKYCFEYWQLKEVYLLCSSENMASVKTALACGFTKMSSIEVSIQNSVFLQDIVEHCLNDCACVSTSLLFLFARKAL